MGATGQTFHSDGLNTHKSSVMFLSSRLFRVNVPMKASSPRLGSCCIRPFVEAAICPVLKTTAWRKINLPVEPTQITAVCMSYMCIIMYVHAYYCSHMLQQYTQREFGDESTPQHRSVRATYVFEAAVSVAVHHLHWISEYLIYLKFQETADE